MIIAMTRFILAQPVTTEAARELFLATAPRYQGVEGLLRKNYLLGADGRHVGGIYLWRSKTDAERFHDVAWQTAVFDKYGVMPELSLFESPVLVDNESGEVVVAP